MNTTGDVAIAAGSVLGRAHRRAGRGNQDAFAWRTRPGAAVAAVCDGCGSGARSEVGACLGARLWTAAIAERIAAGGDVGGDALWLDARDAVLARLREIALAMGGDLEATTREHFLFTSVIAAWTATTVAIAAIGDGVLAIDDEITVLGPFEDNQPPYLGYGLAGAPPPFTALVVGDAGAVSSILIGTDGAGAFVDGAEALVDAGGEAIGALSQFTRGERWLRNPDALRRRLAVINREELGFDHRRGAIERRGGPLDDDTTIVVLRRQGGGAS
jgi:Protein phosphatase 2C